MTDLTRDELALCRQVRSMCACNQLRRASRGMTQVYDSVVAQSGLTVTQLPVLVGLGSAGPLPVTTLAGALGLDRTTLTRNLKVLEQRGLVQGVEHEGDARVRMMALTDAGSSVLSEALARWERVQQAVQERFGEQRLRALYAELDELAAVAAG
jgi:DNA-binding MarR family transcriptional regulator